MSSRDAVPEGVLWTADGHASEWVLSALVDGEEALLPEDAVSHVDGCEHCIHRLATMATLFAALDEELSLVVEQQARREAPFPLPLFVGAATFIVGFVLSSWSAEGRAIGELPHELLTVSRGLRLVGPFAAERLGVELAVLAAFAALVATVCGVLLAKRHPLHRTPESPS